MKVGLGIEKDVNNVKHLRSIIGYDKIDDRFQSCLHLH